MNDGGKLPWVKFSFDDWTNDLPLSRCSMGAQGLWMRMLAIMHHGEPYGHLATNGVPFTMKELASRIGKENKVGIKMVTKWVQELKKFGVLSQTKSGVIYSRRLVRDEANRLVNRANGMKGGNPKIVKQDHQGDNPGDKGGVNPPVNRGLRLDVEVDVRERYKTPLPPPGGGFLATPSETPAQPPKLNPRALGTNPRAQSKRLIDEHRQRTKPGHFESVDPKNIYNPQRDGSMVKKLEETLSCARAG